MLGVESRERELSAGKTQVNGSSIANILKSDSPLYLKFRSLSTRGSNVASQENSEERFPEEKMEDMKSEATVLSSETVLGRIEDTSSLLSDTRPAENEEMNALQKKLEKEKEKNDALMKTLEEALKKNDGMKVEIEKQKQ